MGEMEQAFIENQNAGHEAIVAVVRDLGNLGYRIKSVNYENLILTIACYCPQVNEGSKEPFNWVGLSEPNDSGTPEKAE